MYSYILAERHRGVSYSWCSVEGRGRSVCLHEPRGLVISKVSHIHSTTGISVGAPLCRARLRVGDRVRNMHATRAAPTRLAGSDRTGVSRRGASRGSSVGSRAIGAHHLASPRRAVPRRRLDDHLPNGTRRVDHRERWRRLRRARGRGRARSQSLRRARRRRGRGCASRARLPSRSTTASRAPYPGAPWSVTLAAAILTARDGGEESPWARYVASLPRETIGFANSPAADDPASVEILFDDAADELERYLTLLRGSHRAMTMMRHEWTLEEWRWAMSQVHSRTFRVEEPSTARRQTRRLMVPPDRLAQSRQSRGRVAVQLGLRVGTRRWGRGLRRAREARRGRGGGGARVVGGGRDRHFCVLLRVLRTQPAQRRRTVPKPRGGGGVYEKLCDDGENAAEAWSRARETAVATVREEETSNATATETSSEGDEDREWTSADAEAEEEAALRVGARDGGRSSASTVRDSLRRRRRRGGGGEDMRRECWRRWTSQTRGRGGRGRGVGARRGVPQAKARASRRHCVTSSSRS